MGDDILLTKAIAVEGTSVIARRKGKDLEAVFGLGFVQKCRGFIESPGISILKDAEIAVRYGDIHSMHDPTEGGLATGLFEVATAADVGLIVEEECISRVSGVSDPVQVLWIGPTRSYRIRFIAYCSQSS